MPLKQNATNINSAIKAMIHLSAYVLEDLSVLLQLANKCFFAITLIAENIEQHRDFQIQRQHRDIIDSVVTPTQNQEMKGSDPMAIAMQW